jgi:hypothetical protein
MCRAWGTSMGWLRPSYSRLSLVLGGPHNNQQPANQDLAGAIPARARRQRHGKPPNPRLAHAAVHSASTLRPTPHPSQGVDPALATLPRHFVPSNRLRLMIFGDFLPAPSHGIDLPTGLLASVPQVSCPRIALSDIPC